LNFFLRDFLFRKKNFMADGVRTPMQPSTSSGMTNEELSKTLLAGLRKNQTPPSVTSAAVVAQTQELLKSGISTEEVSKSLLSLLHASTKERGVDLGGGKPSGDKPTGLSMLFEAATKAASSLPATPLTGGVSVSELEATMKIIPAPPVVINANIHVITPIPGSAPLCGVELRVEPYKGYRVIRVTEKPGQSGRIKEGDLILSIDGHDLWGKTGQAMRDIFGAHLRDNVGVTIERVDGGNSLLPERQSPEALVERKLDFALMLTGAGVDSKHALSAQLPHIAKQAHLISQSFNIDGRIDQSEGQPPMLVLKGRANLVDKAMRQFCVVIVKAAIAAATKTETSI
jgi:hypothetical protein